MKDLEVILYKCPNKFSEPEKFLLNNENTIRVSENDFIHIQVISKYSLDNQTTIWLADYQFDLIPEGSDFEKHYYFVSTESIFSFNEQDKFSNVYSINQQHKLFNKLFLNFYGICEVEVQRTIRNKVTYERVSLVEVISDKIADVNFLLEYLFDKDFFFWNIISLSKSTAQAKFEKINENVLWKLLGVDKYVKQFLESFLDNVLLDKFYQLQPSSQIKTWNEDDILSENSLFWLLDNLNKLEIANIYDDNHFFIQNRPYKSESIRSEIITTNTDVYENKIIHWFVEELFAFINRCKEAFETRMNILDNNLHSFKEMMFYRYFKRLSSFVDDLENELIFIRSSLENSIPVSSTSVSTFDSQRLQSKPHYYEMYMNIISWTDQRQVNFFPDLIFAGIKDISKLYEMYCLFSIIDTLTNDLNFELKTDKNINDFSRIIPSENLLGFDNLIPTIYSFSGNQINLTLYYENLPESITTIIAAGKKGLRPDFFLEIVKNNGEKYYLILDAKYKKIENIQKYEFADLGLKYLHGLGPRKGGTFRVLGLIILHPIEDTGTNFYQSSEFNIFGQNTVFPVIGRVEVSVKKRKSNHLKTLLEKFFQASQLA